MNLQDLQNPKIYALLAGAGAGALLAPKEITLPQGVSEESKAVGLEILAVLSVAGVAIPLAMAHFAPSHPRVVGVISGLSGAMGIMQSGAGVGNVASLLVGGSLLWGSPALKDYAVMGLMGIGGLSFGSGAVTLSRYREKLLISKAPSAPIMPPVTPAPATK